MKTKRRIGIALMIALLLVGGVYSVMTFLNWKDRPQEYFGARIVDLSQLDVSSFSTTKSARIDWATETPCGLAVFDPRENRFLVFPFTKRGGFSELLSIEVSKMPSCSVAVSRLFSQGKTYRLSSVYDTEIVVRISEKSRFVGSIRATNQSEVPMMISTENSFLY